MDKSRKDNLKKIAVLFIMLAIVNILLIGMFLNHEDEEKENALIYNEMEIVYEEIIEENGEYSFEAFEYKEIMDKYKSDYVPIWFLIFAFSMISLAVYCVWYTVFNMWLVVYK